MQRQTGHPLQTAKISACKGLPDGPGLGLHFHRRRQGWILSQGTKTSRMLHGADKNRKEHLNLKMFQ